MTAAVSPRPARPARSSPSVVGRLCSALLAMLACAALVAACGRSPDAASEGKAGGQAGGAPAGPGGAPMAMPVTAVEVRSTRLPIVVEAVGQAEGSKEVEVRARVPGVLMRRLFREGDVVKAGAPLFQIDRAPFEIALEQARAALAQETSGLEQARREAARLRPLAEQRAISQREADDAESALKRAEAAVKVAQARVREAELNLSYTLVTAPIAGVTGRAERSEGSLVNAGSDSLLTRIAVTDPIWVRFSFGEAEWARLDRRARDTTVTLQLADGSRHPATGRLNFSASTIDPRLGTVQLRAAFPNPKLELLPGQFVRAQVKVGEEEAFRVPQAAVQTSDQGRFVWVVGAEGKAEPRPVETGAWIERDWVVRKGLADGDRVIVDNILKLRPGVPVAASDSRNGAK